MVEEIEIDLLLEAVFRRYGYNFREYSKAHVTRRILRRLELNSMRSVPEYMHMLLESEEVFEQFLLDLSINVTEMFRDPPFFRALLENVFQILSTFPSVRIWCSGCATGEEVYSIAIMLSEGGILEKSLIYATDYSEKVLTIAQEGIYSIDLIKNYGNAYKEAGGQYSLSDYYISDSSNVIMQQFLREHIVFARHNLVTDGVFSEVQLVVCRNVLIYFSRELQDRALKLFADSICRGGFLALGMKESIEFSSVKDYFKSIDERNKLFKRIAGNDEN